MEKLYKQSLEVKTYEILSQFVDLSASLIQTRKQNVSLHPSHSDYALCNITRFSTGRQTGKTSAIAKYLDVHDNAMVVTLNRSMKDHVSERCGWVFSTERIYIFNDRIENDDEFIKQRSDTSPALTVIFDEIEFHKAMEFVHRELNNSYIGAIVIVGIV